VLVAGATGYQGFKVDLMKEVVEGHDEQANKQQHIASMGNLGNRIFLFPKEGF
jgi:hypothetical protein